MFSECVLPPLLTFEPLFTAAITSQRDVGVLSRKITTTFLKINGHRTVEQFSTNQNPVSWILIGRKLFHCGNFG